MSTMSTICWHNLVFYAQLYRIIPIVKHDMRLMGVMSIITICEKYIQGYFVAFEYTSFIYSTCNIMIENQQVHPGSGT